MSKRQACLRYRCRTFTDGDWNQDGDFDSGEPPKKKLKLDPLGLFDENDVEMLDVEEMEAYAKKIGKDWPEWEDEIDDFLKQAPITSGMIDDMIKVLGPDWEQNEKLSADQ